jgi:FtsH-binding integral membrane protein
VVRGVLAVAAAVTIEPAFGIAAAVFLALGALAFLGDADWVIALTFAGAGVVFALLGLAMA